MYCNMKNKDYSKIIKLLLVLLGFLLSLLKWFSLLPSATISEIWQVIAMAYAVGLGTMDFNIIVDTWKGK